MQQAQLRRPRSVTAHKKTGDGRGLGGWLYRQIKRWRTGKLAEDEHAVLELFGVTRCPSTRPTICPVPA